MYTNKEKNIGELIRILRKLMDLTQEEFGDYAMIGRTTVIQIEKANLPEEIHTDIMYRIYYLCSILAKNEDCDDYIKFFSLKIIKTIEEELNKRIDSKIYSKENIIKK